MGCRLYRGWLVEECILKSTTACLTSIDVIFTLMHAGNTTWERVGRVQDARRPGQYVEESS